MAWSGQKGMPNCTGCCDTTCLIVSFDGTTLTGTTTTGSPSASGGVWHLGSGDRVIVSTGPLTNLQPVHWTFTLYAAGTATMRAIVAYEDASNYLFVEFSTDTVTATIRNGMRVGGVDSYLGAAVTLDDPDFTGRPTVTVCWTPASSVAASDDNTVYARPYDGVSNGSGVTDEDNVIDEDDTPALLEIAGSGGTSDTLGAYFHVLLPPLAIVTGISAHVRAFDTSGDGDVNLGTIAIGTVATGALGTPKSSPTQIISPLGFEWYGYPVPPSDSDDFGGAGASITPANATQFWITVDFTDAGNAAGSPFPKTIWVDTADVFLFYSTPDHIDGSLRGSYHNTTGTNRWQCATSHVQTTSTGKLVGVASTSGSIEVDDAALSYQYSVSRPDCPTCTCTVETVDGCTCCAEGYEAAATMIVDFAGTLTDGSCDYCDEIDGPYSLDSVGSCLWQGAFALTDCDSESPALNMTLALVDDGAGSCKWTLWLSAAGVVTDPSDPDRPFAYYESASIASDHDCQTTATLYLITSSLGNGRCVGSWPASMDVSV